MSSPLSTHHMFKDETGNVHGCWRVIEFDCIKSGRAHWRCECTKCGRRFSVGGTNIRKRGSAGCAQCQRVTLLKKATSSATRHGHAKHGRRMSPTYISWRSMKLRCYCKKHKYYHRYGGRGVSVCRRWLHSFENFLADMGERPPGMTLDRFPNNDGNYESGNCRWATPKQQQANKGRRQK